MDQNTEFMVCKMPKKAQKSKKPSEFQAFCIFFLEFHGMQDMEGNHRTTPLN